MYSRNITPEEKEEIKIPDSYSGIAFGKAAEVPPEAPELPAPEGGVRKGEIKSSPSAIGIHSDGAVRDGGTKSEDTGAPTRAETTGTHDNGTVAAGAIPDSLTGGGAEQENGHDDTSPVSGDGGGIGQLLSSLLLGGDGRGRLTRLFGSLTKGGLPGFMGGRAPGGGDKDKRKPGFSLPSLGTEEIILLCAAALLFFSKEGDRECALIILLLLFIK